LEDAGSDAKKRFGDKLRELRLERGLTQERLAELAQLDRTYVSGVERGRRNVSLSNIHRLALALDVPASELLEPGR
jgi:transcriptional regulator with XRE-family HTH domain